MEKELPENHQRYLARKEQYKSFGYDIDRERTFIVKQAQPIRGSILEAGTGKGHFALVLAKEGYKFTTFDISQEEQRFAKLNLEYYGLRQNVNFLIEDGEHTSFKDNSFDVIFSVNTIHHLTRPYLVVDEFTRILADKGKIVLSDFTEEGMQVMDKMHALEGAKHQASGFSIDDIKKYLIGKDFKTKQARTRYQEVLIAEKGERQ